MKRASGALIAIVLMCAAKPAAAQPQAECEAIRARGPILQTLDTLWARDCLGGERDHSDAFAVLATALRQAEHETDSDAEKLAYVRAIVLYQQAALQSAADQSPLPNATGPHPLALFAEGMATLRQDLEAGATSDMLDADVWDYLPSSHEVGDGVGGDYSMCASLLSRPDCTADDRLDPTEYQVAESLLRHAKLMDRLGDLAHAPELDAFTTRIASLQEMWRQYAVEARSQTPIELAINSWRFKHDLATEGFVRPPSQQIIALHPSVAMEYVGDADDGSRFEPALMVEWIGINRWRWRGGESPRMEDPIGVSLVSTYSDRAGTRDVGHGIVLHYKHVYSLGVTRHGGDTGVFVSVDLQKLLMDKKEKLADVRAKFRVLH